jgi:hypothetical protein
MLSDLWCQIWPSSCWVTHAPQFGIEGPRVGNQISSVIWSWVLIFILEDWLRFYSEMIVRHYLVNQDSISLPGLSDLFNVVRLVVQQGLCKA